MQLLFISECASVVRGGKTTNTDISEAQNANVIPYNDRYLGMVKVLGDVPESLHPPHIYRYNMDADGLQDNGTLRTMFNGRNAVGQGANPMIDFGAGSWDAPLDSYVNPAVRWTQTTPSGGLLIGKKYRIATVGTTDWTTVGAASNTVGVIFTATETASGTGEAELIAQSGDFVVGCWYEIDTPGTTDFTTIGAADNLAGTMFQATETTPGGTGIALATFGARHGDMCGCEYDDGVTVKQQLYVNVYDYNNSAGNQLVLIESEDGFSTYDVVGEILDGGGNFGHTIADVIQRPGTTDLYMLYGLDAGVGRGAMKMTAKSADGGVTWADTGATIPLSSDTASPRYYGMPVGRFVHATDTHVWASIPASRVTVDRPEVNIIVYATWADLDAGVDWTLWPHAGLVRGPTASTAHNVDMIWLPDGSGIGLHNMFGAQSWDDINTDKLNTARDTNTYAWIGAGTNKHTTALRTINRLAIDNPGWWPFEDGDTIRLSSFGKYLSVAGLTEGSNAVLADDVLDPNTLWVAERVGEVFWRLNLSADPTKSLALGGAGAHASNRAIGFPFELRTHGAAEANNLKHHFAMQLVGGLEPDAAVLVNRKSSLALHRDCSQRPLLHMNPQMIWNLEVVA